MVTSILYGKRQSEPGEGYGVPEGFAVLGLRDVVTFEKSTWPGPAAGAP
jgi:hypothetical protein